MRKFFNLIFSVSNVSNIIAQSDDQLPLDDQMHLSWRKNSFRIPSERDGSKNALKITDKGTFKEGKSSISTTFYFGRTIMRLHFLAMVYITTTRESMIQGYAKGLHNISTYNMTVQDAFKSLKNQLITNKNAVKRTKSFQ